MTAKTRKKTTKKMRQHAIYYLYRRALRLANWLKHIFMLFGVDFMPFGV